MSGTDWESKSNSASGFQPGHRGGSAQRSEAVLHLDLSSNEGAPLGLSGETPPLVFLSFKKKVLHRLSKAVMTHTSKHRGRREEGLGPGPGCEDFNLFSQSHPSPGDTFGGQQAKTLAFSREVLGSHRGSARESDLLLTVCNTQDEALYVWI
jgi:hypothetical protein